MSKHFLFATFALVLTLGCEEATSPILTGQWGGPDASLILATTGGTVQYSCGGGRIDPGWTLSSDGRWAASGDYYSGGPIPAEGHPATYAGQLDGVRLTFTVKVIDLNQVLGPFTVEREEPGVVELCQ